MRKKKKRGKDEQENRGRKKKTGRRMSYRKRVKQVLKARRPQRSRDLLSKSHTSKKERLERSKSSRRGRENTKLLTSAVYGYVGRGLIHRETLNVRWREGSEETRKGVPNG